MGNVFGNNLNVIDRNSRDIVRLLGSIRGVAGGQVEPPPDIPEFDIRLKPDQLNGRGARPVDVLDAIQSAYLGSTVVQTYEGTRTYDVTVVLALDARNNLGDVVALMLRNPYRLAVLLREQATIGQVSGLHQITHDRSQRMQTVSVDLGSRLVSDFVSEAQARVNRDIVMPKGTYVVFLGDSEARKQSQHDLLSYGATSAAGIALLLFLAMKSRPGVVLVIVKLPFPPVGGVLRVLLTGDDLPLVGMVGVLSPYSAFRRATRLCRSATTSSWCTSTKYLGAWSRSCAARPSA